MFASTKDRNTRRPSPSLWPGGNELSSKVKTLPLRKASLHEVYTQLDRSARLLWLGSELRLVRFPSLAVGAARPMGT